MLKSMTGFGSAAAENEEYKAEVELKAVNQRFLEIGFHMDHALDSWETEMRKNIQSVAARGKIDVFVRLTDKRGCRGTIEVDRDRALAVRQALNELCDLLHVARPDDVAAFLSFPDLLKQKECSDCSGAGPIVLEALRGALAQLDEMRQREGTAIGEDFLRRLNLLEQLTERIRAMAPSIVESYREHLHHVMEEILQDHPLDEDRLLQETALYADKINYTEEVVRLGSHFRQYRQILQDADGPVGRKLDFLLQEINRETNTIGSKANSAGVSQLVVDMKSETEKLREQVQNIE